MGSPATTEERAAKAGLALVTVSDRVEVRKGNKVIAFHKHPDQALSKALERLEEDRLRKLDPLPENREPILIIPPRRRPARARRAVPVVAPPMPDPPPAPVVLVLPGKGPIKGSIIPSKYRDRYKKNNFSCGDDIAEELRLYLITLNDKGQARVDLVKLREVAEANGVWRDTYAKLNVGQQRMNIGNRLRAKHAEGEAINIGGVVFQLKFD